MSKELTFKKNYSIIYIIFINIFWYNFMYINIKMYTYNLESFDRVNLNIFSTEIPSAAMFREIQSKIIN